MIARGVGAAARVLYGVAGLTVLVIGLPLLLAYGVGWPLPREFPSWDELRSALGGSTVSDTTILKLLAVAGWLAWAQMVASTATELVAWLRGRAAPLLPVAGPLQPFVRHLLLCVLLVGGATKVSPPPEPIRAALVSASEPRTSQPCLPVGAASTEPARAPAPQPAPTYSVKPRDALWKIAEEVLGDGLRWRELYDLNRGVPQPDGRSLEDPGFIRPGWTLALPSDAAVSVPPSPQATAPTAPPPAGDSTPSTSTTVTTTTIAPAAPGDDAAAPTADVAQAEPNVDEQYGEHSDDALPAPVGVGGAGLLAAGLVVTLTRLRRAQVRRRAPGRGVPVPPPDAGDVERRLRAVASIDRAERVALAMRAVGACLRAAGHGSVPGVDAVLVGDDIEILFSENVDVDPGPFRVEAPRAWTLPGSTDAARVEALGRDVSPVAPALPAVGRIDDRDLLIDIERAGVTSIEGDDDGVRALAWSTAACLATSQWSDDVRIVVPRDLLAGFGEIERVEAVDLEEALDRLRADAAATREELASAGAETTLAARLDGGSWTPTVVFVDAASGGPAADEVVRLAAAGRGLAVVSVGASSAADRRLVVRGNAVTVTPPGITAALPELPEQLRAAVGQLVASAMPGGEEPTDDVLNLTAQSVPTEAALAMPASGPMPEGALLVRVLGPVEIDGGRAIDRRKSEELIVYLALHPDGADEQALKTALWSDTLPAAHAFNQVVSRARICLGTAPDGTHYLPRLEGGRYRLNEWVTSDVDRLACAFRAARSLASAESVDELSSALRLARGQPFEGVKTGYEWAHSEGLATRYEILAAEAAHLVAEWYLERNEPTPALWAAGQGLLASPYDEALYRDRMRAYAMAGNDAAVESVMRELCRAVDAVEPYDSLHPETLELYESLTRRRVG